MKFLIAGLGSIGRRHLRNLLALGERDILFYRSGLGTLPNEDLADFLAETDLEAALGHQPDVVIVSNPTALHLDVAIPAARAGCHLLLEKPISHSDARLDELRQAVAQGGGEVLVGYQFRFHPALLRVAELLAAGEIIRPLSARAHWGECLPDWHPWEDYRQGYSARKDLGGGVVLTLSHPLDYLRCLLGEVESLWGQTAQVSDLELTVEDCAEIGLQFASGALGSLHLDYYQRPASHWLEIIGEGGTIRWDNEDGGVHLYRADNRTWTSDLPPAGFERNDLFLAEMRHMIAVAAGEASPVCTLDDGIRALELALAVHRASQTGKRVHFPEKGV